MDAVGAYLEGIGFLKILIKLISIIQENFG
jgi:hypothetical protein